MTHCCFLCLYKLGIFFHSIIFLLDLHLQAYTTFQAMSANANPDIATTTKKTITKAAAKAARNAALFRSSQPTALEPTTASSHVDIASAEETNKGKNISAHTIVFIMDGQGVPENVFGVDANGKTIQDDDEEDDALKQKAMRYFQQLRPGVSAIIVRLPRKDWGPFKNSLLIVLTSVPVGSDVGCRTKGTPPPPQIKLYSGSKTLASHLILAEGTPLPRRIVGRQIRKTLTTVIVRYFGSAGCIPPKDILCINDPDGHFRRDHVSVVTDPIATAGDTNICLLTAIRCGRIDPNQLAPLSRLQEMGRRKDESDAYLDRVELSGPIEMVFQQRDSDGVIVPGSEEKRIQFIARPGETGRNDQRKAKHLWLYGSSNTGKTAAIKEAFLDGNTKTCLIPDPRNAMEGDERAQFIVMDEYGYKRRVPLQSLKALTSGDASAGSFNRKSYGKSFTPRSDAQIIIVSNHSPYDVYGSSQLGQPRKISKEDADALENRFQIVAVGMDHLMQKKKHMDLQDLTHDEYCASMHDIFYRWLEVARKNDTLTTQSIRMALRNAMSSHILRYQRDGFDGARRYEDLRVDFNKALKNEEDKALVNSVIDSHILRGMQMLEVPIQEDQPVRLYGGVTPYEAIMQAPERHSTPPRPSTSSSCDASAEKRRRLLLGC